MARLRSSFEKVEAAPKLGKVIVTSESMVRYKLKSMVKSALPKL